MTRFLAAFGRRHYNRVDMMAAGMFAVCLTNQDWIAAILALPAWLLLSAVCEGAALSKQGGGTLNTHNQAERGA
jgi:hypothetical protein